MARIALKVDVDTLRGTLEGVPRLLRLLDSHGLQATFLFSLGPDHTGWALKRVFRPGFLSKVARTSVLKHYGLQTLMYGVLLPAPDIGRRAAGPMRNSERDGHECGLHTWDHVVWQDNVRRRDAAWTQRQMALAHDRFVDIFGKSPATHGAAGWQMNEHALRQIDAWGMAYSSDSRGDGPFRPVAGGQLLQHVQWPTTLPTFDEMVGTDGIDETNVHRAVMQRTEYEQDQVFTLHAELEGGQFAASFERLVEGWRAQGHRMGTLGDLHRSYGTAPLPQRPLAWGEVPGRSGELVVAQT